MRECECEQCMIEGKIFYKQCKLYSLMSTAHHCKIGVKKTLFWTCVMPLMT